MCSRFFLSVGGFRLSINSLDKCSSYTDTCGFLLGRMSGLHYLDPFAAAAPACCLDAAPPLTLIPSFLLIQFSRSVTSNSLWPHGLQHARPPCPAPTPGVYSNSCLLSQWCHPTISSSVVRFSSRLQSFPASGSFPMSQFFTSSGQKYWSFTSASVLPMNIQDQFPLGWTSLISLKSEGFSRVFSNTPVQKHQFFNTQLSL